MLRRVCDSAASPCFGLQLRRSCVALNLQYNGYQNVSNLGFDKDFAVLESVLYYCLVAVRLDAFRQENMH